MLNAALSPIQEIVSEELTRSQLRLFVKRDDLLHPHISGNKWRKLKYNLQQAYEEGYQQLLTFGGAYSNHIAATAAAGQEFGFQTIGIIRGEATQPLNPTLQFAQACGMRLHFVSRIAYKSQKEVLAAEIQEQVGSCYVLPEGGTNCLAVKGCAELVSEVHLQVHNKPDYYCLACGTGGTTAGIITALQDGQQAIGFSALKGDFLQREVEQLLQQFCQKKYSNWQINTTYHFGGYAKFKPELLAFMASFQHRFGIPLDPIYTGKLFFGLFDLIKTGYFPAGSTIVAVHTGGLQGVAGFQERFGDWKF